MHQIWCTLARRAKSSPWRGKVKGFPPFLRTLSPQDSGVSRCILFIKGWNQNSKNQGAFCRLNFKKEMKIVLEFGHFADLGHIHRLNLVKCAFVINQIDKIWSKKAFVINQIGQIWSKVTFVINQIGRIKSGIDIYPNQIGYIWSGNQKWPSGVNQIWQHLDSLTLVQKKKQPTTLG